MNFILLLKILRSILFNIWILISCYLFQKIDDLKKVVFESQFYVNYELDFSKFRAVYQYRKYIAFLNSIYCVLKLMQKLTHNCSGSRD